MNRKDPIKVGDDVWVYVHSDETVRQGTVSQVRDVGIDYTYLENGIGRRSTAYRGIYGKTASDWSDCFLASEQRQMAAILELKREQMYCQLTKLMEAASQRAEQYEEAPVALELATV